MLEFHPTAGTRQPSWLDGQGEQLSLYDIDQGQSHSSREMLLSGTSSIDPTALLRILVDLPKRIGKTRIRKGRG